MKDYILGILKESFEKIIMIMGFLLICGSFCNYNLTQKFYIDATPNIYLFISGWVIIVVGFFLFILVIKSGNQNYKLRRSLTLKAKNIEFTIKYDTIENSIGANETAIVLPANTMLDDECINDKRSALGAFILTKLPDKKEVFTEEIKSIRNTFNNNSACEPGSSFLLKNTYGLNHNIILTCVTEKKHELGVHSSINNIIKSIESIYKISSENKISRIILPVLGGGHGGIDINISIQTMLLASLYFSKTYHAIKFVEIILLEKEKSRINPYYNYFLKFK
jgi:hypothetical protein